MFFRQIETDLYVNFLWTFCLSSGNFSPIQSAYRQYHSTETALLHTLDYVYHSSDNRQPTIVVSLDSAQLLILLITPYS